MGRAETVVGERVLRASWRAAMVVVEVEEVVVVESIVSILCL